MKRKTPKERLAQHLRALGYDVEAEDIKHIHGGIHKTLNDLAFSFFQVLFEAEPGDQPDEFQARETEFHPAMMWRSRAGRNPNVLAPQCQMGENKNADCARIRSRRKAKTKRPVTDECPIAGKTPIRDESKFYELLDQRNLFQPRATKIAGAFSFPDRASSMFLSTASG